MIDVELNLFTNSTVNSPSTDIILETYESFLNTFGDQILTTVWCDLNPNLEKSEEYFRNLKKIFSTVNKTNSLSEGYISSIIKSKSKYLFMLEHDWKFNSNISHTLEQILYYMNKENLWHLRFNKRRTEVRNADRWLRQRGDKNFYYCLTPSISNNPHIIDREKYIEYALPKIKLSHGSFGLEENLSDTDIVGAIYGHLYYESTITHLDGRNGQWI